MPVPRRADDTILPGVLAGVLASLLCLQFWLTGVAPELPPVLPVGAPRVAVAVPEIGAVRPANVIFQRPLFAPRQSLVASASGAPALVMGGATVAGSVTIRGRSFAVVRRGNGTFVNLGIGGRIGGWRLVALRQDGAAFVNGAERRVLPYGAAAVPASEEDAPAE